MADDPGEPGPFGRLPEDPFLNNLALTAPEPIGVRELAVVSEGTIRAQDLVEKSRRQLEFGVGFIEFFANERLVFVGLDEFEGF